MEYDIVHHPEKYRFEMKQDGLTAFVQYRLVGNNLDIIHTIVPVPLEGLIRMPDMSQLLKSTPFKDVR